MATCDPGTLANASVCIDKCIPDGMKLAVMIYLLCQIQANGSTGGGGSGFVLQGVGVPSGTLPTGPSTPSSPALYTDLNTGTIWTWNVTSQTWV